MSGISGILNLDGSTIDCGLLSKMAEAIKERGPDGIKIWNEGPIGLVHSHFWTTPEDLGEEQPISDVEGRYWLAADARIDNRDELLPLLKKTLNSEIPTDAEIILAAYKQWGEECTRHLIGDFAFALWDSREQHLFCARDPAGVRLLHYHKSNKSFIFASSIRAVLCALDGLPAINMPFISDLLADQYDRWVHETAYQGIFRLPPGYSLTLTSNSIEFKRYWIFGSGSFIHFKTDEEYILKFQEIFDEAVRSRLRSTSAIALSVSGGLDSSSLACVFHDLASKGKTNSGGKIYSNVYDHSPTQDEKEFLNEVTKKCRLFDVIRIVSDDLCGLNEFGDDGNFPLEDPDYMHRRTLLLSLPRRACQDDCRVFIDGEFGDHLFCSDRAYSASVLKDINLMRHPFEITHFLHENRSIWKLFAQAYIVPHLSIEVKRILAQLMSKPRSIDPSNYLVTPQYRSSNRSEDFLLPPDLSSNSSKAIYDSLASGFSNAMMVQIDRNAAYSGIDIRHPFLDRRLIDFMLSVPPGLLFRNGFTKYVLRQAMKEILPEKVRNRKGKAYQIFLSPQSLSGNDKIRIADLIKNSRAVSLGLVDKEKLADVLRSYEQDGFGNNLKLNCFLCAEAWLRYYEKQEAHTGNRQNLT